MTKAPHGAFILSALRQCRCRRAAKLWGTRGLGRIGSAATALPDFLGLAAYSRGGTTALASLPKLPSDSAAR